MVQNEDWKSHKKGSVIIWSWEFSGSINRLPCTVLTIWHWENRMNKWQCFLFVLRKYFTSFVNSWWCKSDLKILCITYKHISNLQTNLQTYHSAVAEWSHVCDSYLPLTPCVFYKHLRLSQVNFSLFHSSGKNRVVIYTKRCWMVSFFFFFRVFLHWFIKQ